MSLPPVRVGFALVLAALSAASPAQSVRGPVPIESSISLGPVAHPADVTITVYDATGREAVSFSGMRLHGVAWVDGKDRGHRLVLGERGYALPVRFLRSRYGRGARWSATVAPSGRDLADVCDGARLTEDPTRDAGPDLNWCFRIRGPGHTLSLPEGVVGFVGPVLLPDSTTIEGAGGAALDRFVTDARGVRYRPVTRNATHGRPSTTLRVLDGEAFTVFKPDSALTGEQLARRVLHQDLTALHMASGAHALTVRDVEFDGNDRGDITTLRTAYRRRAPAGSDGDRRPSTESVLRNGPGHTAIMAGNNGGLVVPQNADGSPGRSVTVERVAIRGFAATALLGHADALFRIRELYVADAAYNHLLYAADGDVQHLTVEGYAWTHLLAYRGRYRNVVVRNLTPSPLGRDGEPIDARMGHVARGDSLVFDGLYADTIVRDTAGRGVSGSRLAWASPSGGAGRTGEPAADRTFVLRNASVVFGPNSGPLVDLRRRGPVRIERVALHTDLGAYRHRDGQPFQGAFVSGSPAPGSAVRDATVTVDMTGVAAQSPSGAPNVRARQFALLRVRPGTRPTAVAFERVRLSWPLVREAASASKWGDGALPTAVTLCDVQDEDGPVALRYRNDRERAVLTYQAEDCAPTPPAPPDLGL